MKRPPLKLFFCYARDDVALRDRLDAHFELLRREGLITTWHDRRISPGSEWSATIEENLRGSDVVVFLLSRSFFASEYIAEVEMRLAMELHEEGSARVVPVLAEPVDDFGGLNISRLQALPLSAEDLRPISEWDDEVRALDAVAAGVRRAAVDVIIAGGGPFEFGSHQFTEAELAPLDPPDRARALDGLHRLRRVVVESVPSRRLHGNLLVASWCLNKLGAVPVLPESLFYMAQVVSAFDVVAFQEIHRDLGDFDRLLTILGPEWGYAITDITEGRRGNLERFAIVYYRPRVASRNISGEVVLPDDRLVDGRQFARKPLLGSFRAGEFPFRLCTAHVTFGGGAGPAGAKEGLAECAALAEHLARVSSREGETIVLAGNFQIRAPDSPAVAAFTERGFEIPPDTIHPSVVDPNRGVASGYCSDLVGFRRQPQTGSPAWRVRQSGVLNPFQSVYREEDETLYSHEQLASILPPGSAGADRPRFFQRQWRTRQLSDHLPIWVELDLDGA